MDYDLIQEKVDNREYETKLDYPSHEDNKVWEKHTLNEMRKAYRKDNQKLEQKFKSDCRKFAENELGKLTDKQFQEVYANAWELGHSSGYREVLIYLDRLIEVIREFVPQKGDK